MQTREDGRELGGVRGEWRGRWRPGGQGCCHLPSGCDRRLEGRNAAPTSVTCWRGRHGKKRQRPHFPKCVPGRTVVPLGPLEGAEEEDWVRAPSPMSHGAGYRPVDSKDSMNTILIAVIYDLTMSTALHTCFPCWTVNFRRQVPCLSCCLL